MLYSTTLTFPLIPVRNSTLAFSPEADKTSDPGASWLLERWHITELAHPEPPDGARWCHMVLCPGESSLDSELMVQTLLLISSLSSQPASLQRFSQKLPRKFLSTSDIMSVERGLFRENMPNSCLLPSLSPDSVRTKHCSWQALPIVIPVEEGSLWRTQCVPLHCVLDIEYQSLLPVSSFRVCWGPLYPLLKHSRSANPAWPMPSR